jgi:RepB plasmid partitioning protein/ParB-like nuclease domain
VNNTANLAFELKTVLLPVSKIVPRITVTDEIRKSKKYRQIAASIEHVGLIEPLVVSAQTSGSFLLLDGALRLDVLVRREESEIRCILATDDEGYTYNKRVNHLSNIGEHYMILKALANGVSEQMISASLNVDVETIRRKRSLLDGICPEAVQLLLTRRVSTHAYGFLRKMKPLGQIQAAERMIHANSFSEKMAKALFTITKPELLVHQAKVNRASPGTAAKLSLLQQEADTLLTDVKQVEETYATQALDLTLSLGYVEHLLSNSRIEKYLAKHHPDILSELKKQIEGKAREMSRPVPDSVAKPRQIAPATKKKANASKKRRIVVPRKNPQAVNAGAAHKPALSTKAR